MEKLPQMKKTFSDQVEIFVGFLCACLWEKKKKISHSKISELAATAYLVRAIFLSFNRENRPHQIMTYNLVIHFKVSKGS